MSLKKWELHCNFSAIKKTASSAENTFPGEWTLSGKSLLLTLGKHFDICECKEISVITCSTCYWTSGTLLGMAPTSESKLYVFEF